MEQIQQFFSHLVSSPAGTQFRESLLVIISTPLYAILIGGEMLLSYFQHKNFYSIKGTLTNVYLTALNMGLDIVLRGVCLLVLNYFYQFHLFTISNVFAYWLLLLVLQDFAYYVLHYVDHHSRFFWAVHATHHSSDEFNLTVGFRSSVFQPLYRFVYFIPLSLMGFTSVDIMFMYAATQIYGILVHTQLIGKLGWFEYLFCTPSNHRVHHASNVPYLDKNMGMVFIFWDRIFGTYKEEQSDIEMEYGLTKKLEKQDPIHIVFHEWIALMKDIWRSDVSILNKIKYLIAPPGWSHNGTSKTSKELQAEYYRQLAKNEKPIE
nr:sterol desaturase family protein [Bacteroidota bacterium]